MNNQQSSTRSARFATAAVVLLLSSVVSSLVVAPSLANGPALERSLAVVLDTETLERSGTLEPQQVVRGHVMLLGFDQPFNDGVRALQFALNVDPRLILTEVTTHALVNVNLQPGPFEWSLGFEDCLEDPALPLPILSFELLLAPGVEDLHDLRVQLSDLVQHGEPMLFSHCLWIDWLEPLIDFGGVVLNPAGPRVVGIATGRNVVVEGRDYEFGWATTGSDSTLVDGVVTSSSGLQTLTATGTRTHEVRAFDAVGNEDVATHEVEVIRAPRFNVAFATETSVAGPSQVQIVWEVDGADAVEVVGVGSFVPRATKLVNPNETGVWELVATNEWGTTRTSVQTIDFATSAPVIPRLETLPPWYVPGEQLWLNYLVLGADEAWIEPDIGPVETGDSGVMISPEGAVTYTLWARNANGTVSRELALVPTAPRIERFTVSPTGIDIGDSIVVSWRVVGANTVRIDPAIGPVEAHESSVTLFPTQSLWYTLTAENLWGESVKLVSSNVKVPSISYFFASPTSAYPGDAVKVGWGTYGATRLELGPPAQQLYAPVGHLYLPVEADSTRFWLRLEAPTDTIVATSAYVTWKVPSLTVTSRRVSGRGTEFEVVVQVAGADSLNLSPGPGTVPGTSGVFQYTVQDTTEVVVTATNRAGSTVRTTTLSPRFDPPSLGFTVSSSSVFGGQSVELRASVSRADSARIDPGVGWIPNVGGKFDVQVDSTTTFVLTAYGRQSTPTGVILATAQRSVTVTARLPVAQLIYNGGPVPRGGTASLRVTAQGATTLTLEPGVGDVISRTQPYAAPVDSATTFVLTATNPAGTVRDSVRVELAPPVITSFAARDTSVIAGGSTVLEWVTVGSDSVRVRASDGATWSGLALSDTLEVQPAQTTTYVLTAMGAAGEDSATTTVSVVPFLIREFRAQPPFVDPGQFTTLIWWVEGQVTVELEGFGEQALQGSLEVLIEEQTTFTLRVSDGETELLRPLVVYVAPPSAPLLSWSTSSDYITAHPFRLRVFEPTEMHVWLDTGTEAIDEIRVRLQLPENVVALSLERFEGAFRTEIQANFLDLVFVKNVDCVYAPAPILLATLNIFAMDHPGAGAVLEFTAITPAPGLPSGPLYFDCQGVAHTLPTAEPFYIGDQGGSAVTATLHATRQREGVRLQWDASQEVCATNVEVLRATNSQEFELLERLEVVGGCVPTTWTDGTAPASATLRYRVLIESTEGEITSNEVQVEAVSFAALSRSRLLPNVPNPFNPRTEIHFELAAPGEVRVEIFDVAGRRVRSFELGNRMQGPGSVVWTGEDDRGAAVASGVYVVGLETTSGQDRRRVVLIR